MRIKKIILLLIIVLVIVLVCAICLHNAVVRSEIDDRNFDDKVCHNLVEAGYLSDEIVCHSTDYWEDAMDPMFPVGEVDLDYVTAGMKGFRQNQKFTFNDRTCENGLDIWYQTIEGIDEYVEFIFCDEVLIQYVIHN